MKRLGIIEISIEHYQSFGREIYRYFLPYKVELEWYRGIWCLIGESEKFDQIQEGEEYPKYEVIVTSSKSNIIKSIEFKRLK